MTAILVLGSGQSVPPVLQEGTTTITATGLTDLLGNVTPTTTTTVDFARDTTPPTIARATALSATVIRIEFSEGVRFGTGGASSSYIVRDAAAGASVSVVEFADDLGTLSGVRVVDLTLSAPLAEGTLYTLEARGILDLAGNAAGPLLARVFFGRADTPEAGDLAITEIMFDPATGSDGEYVEIQNLSESKTFDLRDLTLDDDASGTDPIVDAPAVLLPGEFVAIVADVETFRLAFPDASAVQADGFPGLGNSGDLVILKASGVTLDSVVYDPDWHRVELDDATGISLERRDPRADANDSNNWSSSLDARGGTPGAPNSIGAGAPAPPEDTGLSISPSPFNATLEEGTTISYALEAEASLVRVRIYDGAGRPVRELEAARLTGREGSLLWDGRDDRGERLRIGPYIVLLEAVDVEGGTTEAYKGTVILAREL